MLHTILIAPTHQGVGLTSSIIGIFHSLQRQGLGVTFYKPVAQDINSSQYIDHARHILAATGITNLIEPIPAQQAENLIKQGNYDELIEKIIIQFEKIKENSDIVIIGGLVNSKEQPYASKLNEAIAKALSADIILVTNANDDQFEQRIEYAARPYGGIQSKQLLGAVLNRITPNSTALLKNNTNSIFNNHFKIIAAVPAKKELEQARCIDVANFLDASILHEGDIKNRRIQDFTIVARTIANALDFMTKANYLIIASSDRDDAIMASSLIASSGVPLAGLLLTSDTKPTKSVMELCRPIIESANLPVMQVPYNTWEVARRLDNFNLHIPIDDHIRIKDTMEHFADNFNTKWLAPYISTKQEIRLSPSAFKFSIVKRAQAANKTIVLPEGNEIRTILAANICSKRKIAKCILLAKEDEVKDIAEKQNITLSDNIKIIDPDKVRSKYINRLIELRSHKGMNETLAKTQLEDNVTLATMMLEADEVDGLVSGAVNTTANTIRPPLQIIKTAKESKLVSSIFFMCLPEQIYIYGDCAINPNPNAEELAEIALQSANSAKQFGITPRIAMLSYSTGDSGGSSEEIKKVKMATQIVKEKNPDLIIDGPIQYDAAVIPSIAAKKAPDSKVAGRANVFIFPDLNTGNTTYKAVQRSANAISIGPVLQGMRKPVNDLSRGALIEDIIYTIAITAVQATNNR